MAFYKINDLPTWQKGTNAWCSNKQNLLS